MKRNSEGKCCDAVLRILESQNQATRSDVIRDTTAQPGVEVTCTIGDQHYALEHTLIEPFPDNKVDDIAFTRVFDKTIEQSFMGLLRADLAYDVWIDVYAFVGMDRKQLASVREALIAWLRDAIPRLPAPTDFRQTAIEAQHPEVPIRVRVACHRSSVLGGRLMPGRIAPSELDDLRETRLLKALNDKAPKLHAARRHKSRTVLVLENTDIALTNEGLVSSIIENLASRATYMPDDIFMVNTGSGDRYYVTQVRRNCRPCLLVGDKNVDWEFDASTLAEP